jgi:hypothetical protein
LAFCGAAHIGVAAMPKRRPAPDLPPLWAEPPPRGHNAGPPDLEEQQDSQPAEAAPDLRARLFELLGEGVPLRVICQMAGMPGRTTVYRWRRADPAFDALFLMWQREGFDTLAERVVEEVERVLRESGAEHARFIFNWRREQLTKMNPRQFNSRGMRY